MILCVCCFCLWMLFVVADAYYDILGGNKNENVELAHAYGFFDKIIRDGSISEWITRTKLDPHYIMHRVDAYVDIKNCDMMANDDLIFDFLLSDDLKYTGHHVHCFSIFLLKRALFEDKLLLGRARDIGDHNMIDRIKDEIKALESRMRKLERNHVLRCLHRDENNHAHLLDVAFSISCLSEKQYGKNVSVDDILRELNYSNM